MNTPVLPSLVLLIAPAQRPSIDTSVSLVVVPASVSGSDGRCVRGLTEADFLLIDNERPRPVRVDEETSPIPLVIAIQSSSIFAPALAKIRKIGGLVEPLLIGQGGEAAASSRAMTVSRSCSLSPRTPTPSRQPSRKSKPGDSAATRLTPMVTSVRLLRDRPPDRRRVLLLIGESRDRSSETRLEDAAAVAQQETVAVYAANYSAFATAFTTRPGTVPPGGDAAGVNPLAIFTEVARLGQANAADAFSPSTGGRKVSFLQQRGLEQAVARIAEEIHNQYFLSFSPDAASPGVYPQSGVHVRGRPELVVRARPGYWQN